MKFGTKVLNWTLNDPGNLYYKQTPDTEINKHFCRGPVFFGAPCILSFLAEGLLQPKAKKIFIVK